jgi:hypothetical protein
MIVLSFAHRQSRAWPGQPGIGDPAALIYQRARRAIAAGGVGVGLAPMRHPPRADRRLQPKRHLRPVVDNEGRAIAHSGGRRPKIEPGESLAAVLDRDTIRDPRH